MEGINVHEYGAHIFHTSNHEVWKYIQQFATFNRYTNSPIARYRDEIYNMPFNMNTFNKLWGVITPEQAKKKIEQQIKESGIIEPKNHRGAGYIISRKRHIRKISKRIYTKTMGKKM